MRFRFFPALPLAGIGAAAIALDVRRRQRDLDSQPSPEARSRWHSVTVLGPPAEVMPDHTIPPFLARLEEDIEVEVRLAPADKGTELRARLRDPAGSQAASNDITRRVRSALRRTKQVFEAGEVLRVDPTPHGRRSATPTGLMVDSSTKHADEEGLL